MNYDEIFCPYMYRAFIRPHNAVASINGGALYPRIRGSVYFAKTINGTNVIVDVFGLPPYKPATADSPQIGPHGFHIHAGGNCAIGTLTKPFPETDGHYNPTNQPHGNHIGDFPVLFSNNGHAKMTFFTNKFIPTDVVGRSVVIHLGPDDYKTQPSGGSGIEIACGVIKVSR